MRWLRKCPPGANSSLWKLWKSHSIKFQLRPDCRKPSPGDTYDCESCSLKKSDRDRLRAFEMRGLRQIFRALGRLNWKKNQWLCVTECRSWYQQRTFGDLLENENWHTLEVWTRYEERRFLLGEWRRILLKKTASGSGGKGRSRTAWMDNVKDWTGMTGTTADRKLWRSSNHQWCSQLPTLGMRTARGRGKAERIFCRRSHSGHVTAVTCSGLLSREWRGRPYSCRIHRPLASSRLGADRWASWELATREHLPS